MGGTADTILPLLKVVFFSIFEVFLLCLAGYILAARGIVDRKTQKQLNKLNVSLFTPSLLFSKVAFFLSPKKLRELWIVPIFFVLVTSVSMLVAFLLGWAFRLKRSQRSFAMAASMFMNSNSLPIALMQSLCVTVPGLKWGKSDNTDAMVGRALTYLVLYSTLGMVLRWSYGVRLLAQADPDEESSTPHAEAERTPLIDTDETAFPPSAEEQRLLHHGNGRQDNDQPHTPGYNPELHANFLPHLAVPPIRNERPAHLQRPGLVGKHSSFFSSFPNSPALTPPRTPTAPVAGLITMTESPSSSEDEGSLSDDEELPRPATRRRSFTAPTSTRLQSIFRRTKYKIGRAWTLLYDFMTVPLWAAAASLLVACVRPLQHLLEEHITPIKGALSNAGDCSIPLTLVVLGAYFYTPLEDRVQPKPQANDGPSLSTSTSLVSLVASVKEMFKLAPRKRKYGPRTSGDDALLSASNDKGNRGETKTVAIAVVSRMILTPLILLPLMALAAWFDFGSVFADPVFVVANVLLVSSPPALTLAQITQAASGDAFERLISRTIFWSYCVLTPPATIIYVVIGLLLSKI